jgi:hydroxyacylglutathione hydrolase
LNALNHQLLKDGDKFHVGKLVFEVVHTPGHTPESISFILTDTKAADLPLGIFTGDFVFVGDVGRPDLLQKAAGIQGTSESGAKAMFKSIERFKELPDYLQVWPAHGAGSACGKSLGAVPSTTVGYEKLFNWAMQFKDEKAFMEELLAGQPEPPYYFAVMKSVNKAGPELIADLPKMKPIGRFGNIKSLLEEGAQVLDLRRADAFSQGFIPGTINIPFNKSFTNWAGWVVDYEKPVYILVDPASLDEVVIALHSIGIDQVLGYGDADMLIGQADDLDQYDNVTVEEAKEMIDNGKANVLDVRSQTEFDEGHIENADHIMVGTLKNRLEEVDASKTIIIHCQGGTRSAIAASLLKANGFDNIVNMPAGYSKWSTEAKA